MSEPLVNVERMELTRPTDEDKELHSTYYKVELLSGDIAEDAQGLAIIEVMGETTRMAHCKKCASVGYIEDPCEHIVHLKEAVDDP